MAAYKKTLFDPQSEKPFKLSRSRFEIFMRCPRCFYLDRRLGIEQPPGYPFNLNSAVDILLKKEFDQYRECGRPHPWMTASGINAIPLKHPDLETWRNAFGGIRFFHEPSRFLVFGGIDDVWVSSSGALHIVDYKATSKTGDITLEDEWKDGYKRQIEIYQWLFRRNGFKVSKTAYFVYCNGLRDEPDFQNMLKFKTVLLPYCGDDSWIDPLLVKARRCLENSVLPPPAPRCDYCEYRRIASHAEALYGN